MPDKNNPIVLDEDVFSLTVKASRELQGSGTTLSPKELEVLVLIEGKATAEETASRARTLGKEAVFDILGRLLASEYIEHAKGGDDSLDFVDFFKSDGLVKASATTESKKRAAATSLLLQQQGYSVRIARRAKGAISALQTRALSILVIEDEQHLSNLLKHVFAKEGFDVRVAGCRDEIVAQIRRPPRPDLILLDVVLPDADGFDVLRRIRQHPVLKSTPVVMLTSQSTRDAVLEGLAEGADGYITKPFRIDVLTKAVAAVLGLPGGAGKSEDSEDPWSL